MHLVRRFTSLHTLKTSLLAAALLWGTAAQVASADTPLTTAFTYQGLLKQNGVPANGEVDLKFRLFAPLRVT
jgi:hypothetical protein